MRRRIGIIAVVLVLAGAGVWLWRWSGGDRSEPGLLGGPLFEFSVDQIEAMEIRRLQGVTILRKDESGDWILTGLVHDVTAPERVKAELSALVRGVGYPALPGTRPDERRFGFGGPGSLELVFHLRGGGRQRLAIGGHNPVTELFYASGAGRRGVFGIGGLLYATASRLPDSVRLPGLLPQVRAADLDSLQLGRRGGETFLLARLADGRWWLRRHAGSAPLTGKAARYHERYPDRRTEHAGSTWLLANERLLRDLVYTTTGARVVMLPPEEESALDLDDLGLRPAYRTLDLWVRDGPAWRVDFGEEIPWWQDQNMVPVIRQDSALVLLRPETLHPLLGPVSEFLDLGALSFNPEAADSMRIDEPDRPLVACRRAPDEQQRRQRHESIWDPIAPEGWELTFDRRTTANHLTDLLATLDRLESLEVLDPAPDDPLDGPDRWRARFWLPGEERHEVWLGRLRDGGRPVVWTPDDGKCLEVPETILATLRNMRHYLTRR